MTAGIVRRLSGLERRRRPKGLAFVRIPSEVGVSVGWVRPDGRAVLVLPHNGRDPLPAEARR